MRKNLIVGVSAVLLSFCGWSQMEIYSDENPGIKERIYFFGSPILAIDQSQTVLGFNFGVGYMITPSLSAGVGITYQHATYKLITPKIKTNQIGGNVFARYKISRQFFAYTEYEVIGRDPNLFDADKSKEAIPAFYIGGGLYQPINDKAGISIIALYDLIYDSDKSLNSSISLGNLSLPPELSIRVGITFSPF